MYSAVTGKGQTSGEDDLMYSAGTGTLGNSSLNFGFSNNSKSIMQNNLASKAQ